MKLTCIVLLMLSFVIYIHTGFRKYSINYIPGEKNSCEILKKFEEQIHTASDSGIIFKYYFTCKTLKNVQISQVTLTTYVAYEEDSKVILVSPAKMEYKNNFFIYIFAGSFFIVVFSLILLFHLFIKVS